MTALYYSFICVYHSFLQFCPVLLLSSCLPPITAFILSVSQLFSGLPFLSITVFFMSAHYHSDLHIYLYHNFIFLCPASQLNLFLPCITAFFTFHLYHSYLHVCPISQLSSGLPSFTAFFMSSPYHSFHLVCPVSQLF